MAIDSADTHITEKEYRYWLCNIPGIGARKIAELLHYFGSGEEIWKSTEEALKTAMNQVSEGKILFRKEDFTSLQGAKETLSAAADAYHKLEEKGIRFITPDDRWYPERLRNLYDMPQGLYISGEIPGEKQERPTVAIVGARNCSHYGEEMAFTLARELCIRGVDIISGMALGIDGAAHRGALKAIETVRGTARGRAETVRGQTENAYYGKYQSYEREPSYLKESLSLKENSRLRESLNDNLDNNLDDGLNEDVGKTYAVLGSGVDICYPRTNWDIYHQLSTGSDKGGILSEFPPQTAPVAPNFPMRNRIISGLADMVIVIEARFRSGSLITADQALEQGRDVYAVPGRITDPLSRGCNELIRQGAGIITDPVEFAEKYFSKQDSCAPKCKKNKIALALSEEKVYSCLDFSPTHLSIIVDRTGFSMQETVSVLMQLMMKGLVTETSKNYYALKFR